MTFNLNSMREIIKSIHDRGGILFPPATEKSIDFVNKILNSHGFVNIPKDYQQMLMMCDGFSWNGSELAGTRSEERKEKNYNFPGLIELNLDFMSIEPLRNKLILGRASEELFAYDISTQKYIVIDRQDLNPHSSFTNFYESLVDFMA